MINEYWEERKIALQRDPKAFVVIDGECYYVEDENDTNPYRGHDGRPFTILFNDGEVIHTTNLWYNGEVPEEYKPYIPNNAKFIKEDK